MPKAIDIRQQAREVEAFKALVESETWVSRLVRDLIHLSNQTGHADFAEKTDYIRDMVADAIQQFDLDLEFAKKLVRQHPDKFRDVA